jgi:hypothetical protein
MDVPIGVGESLERIGYQPQRSERVPYPEDHTHGPKDRCSPLEFATYGTTRYGQAEDRREQRHRDCGPSGEEQERTRCLSLVRDGREEEQRDPPRATDAVHEPYAVGRQRRASERGMAVLV